MALCFFLVLPFTHAALRLTDGQKGIKSRKRSNLDSVIDICHLTAFQGPGPPGLGERPVEFLNGCHELPCCVLDIGVVCEWEADKADGQDILRVLEGLKCEYVLCPPAWFSPGSWVVVSLRSRISSRFSIKMENNKRNKPAR
ncbi:hypothetical protein B0T20DRAFT_46706 [Sordaria brevicollis]|uniref:Hydrophobin n=1 Tax=Sordaria brevicollis TaxID=83679 RepID=A0AAE0P9L3_SORBR|nr:hypothetical protein B0T20DRAFT_46706 [Sordaria brevicollis]